MDYETTADTLKMLMSSNCIVQFLQKKPPKLTQRLEMQEMCPLPSMLISVEKEIRDCHWKMS